MTGNIIKKGHDLVEGKYQLTLWEMRVLLRMTSLIRREDQDFQYYEVDTQDFKTFFEIENSGSVYRKLREACLLLMDRKVTLLNRSADGKTEEVTVPLISRVSRIIEDRTLRIAFDPAMKPYLLQLATRFLIYDVKNVLHLNSSHAIRIYEITKAFLGLGKRVIAVGELKAMLGVADKYTQYGHFKQRVLKPSIESINEHTDIRLNLKEVKDGRRIVKLIFQIYQKEKTEVELTEQVDRVGEGLVQLGVSKSVVAKWRSRYDDAHILKRIEHLQKKQEQETIQKPAAYLSSIMDKEITSEKIPFEERLRRARSILVSRPEYERQLVQKYGMLTDKRLVGVLERVFPERFE